MTSTTRTARTHARTHAPRAVPGTHARTTGCAQTNLGGDQVELLAGPQVGQVLLEAGDGGAGSADPELVGVEGVEVERRGLQA